MKQKEYCLQCGKRNSLDQKVCDCGGKSFVYGCNFTLNDNKEVVCHCGNKEFSWVNRINSSPYFETTYVCSKCKNTIGVQTYYKSHVC